MIGTRSVPANKHWYSVCTSQQTLVSLTLIKLDKQKKIHQSIQWHSSYIADFLYNK
jgi:hypothetical protein